MEGEITGWEGKGRGRKGEEELRREEERRGGERRKGEEFIICPRKEKRSRRLCPQLYLIRPTSRGREGKREGEK